MRLNELRNFLADCGDMTLDEVPCAHCRVLTLDVFLEPVDVFPIGKVCSGCADDILADDMDPHAGEAPCECGHGGCDMCLGLSRPGGL